MTLWLRPDDASPNDQRVMHGEWQVGLLEKRSSSLRRNETTWFWALNGVPSPVPTGLCLAGFAGTVDEARAELKKNWSSGWHGQICHPQKMPWQNSRLMKGGSVQRESPTSS